MQLDEQAFNLVDVPGDGNCFYHALLKDLQVLEMHASTQGIRRALVVEAQYNIHDPFLQYIFQQNYKSFSTWSTSVVNPGIWGSNFESMLYTYFFQKNIIIIEAVRFGWTDSTHILTQTYQNWQQKHFHPYVQEKLQTYGDPIFIFLHQFKNPRFGTRLNHFAYLEPITMSLSSMDISPLESLLPVQTDVIEKQNLIVTPSPKKKKTLRIHTQIFTKQSNSLQNCHKVCFKRSHTQEIVFVSHNMTGIWCLCYYEDQGQRLLRLH